MKRICYSTSNGRRQYYAAIGTWIYSSKTLPNWSEITEEEFRFLASIGYQVEDGTTF